METSASSKNPVPFHALIAAAGSGVRLGSDVPKQYLKINGKAILRHTLERFLACPGLQSLRVIIDPVHKRLYDDTVQGLNLPGPVNGGKERKDSVLNGLRSFHDIKKEEIILIHDAARPLLSPDHIQAAAAAATVQKAATLATPVTDTQKYAAGAYIDRNGLWAVQTPQAFEYGLLMEAHNKAGDAAYTDDTALVAALGHEIALVPGPRANIKITTAEDLLIAQKLLAPAYETRTGFGYDVHAFEEGHTVRLCGVDIPYTKKLKGHSDADAGLHALTDALLGTIGAGDIGTHFPPSDPQWKNKDSAVFLQKAIELVTQRGGRLINLDLTLICEEPKIGPHRPAMQSRLAALTGLTEDRIGLKATTSEKLGFLGRGEGVAAQAVASVKFPAEEQ